MDTTQFALFFAAILIAYVLVHVRLARFENYLQEIVELKQLNDRLKGVSDVLERVRLDHVEDLLGQLHDDLKAIHEGQTRLERQFAKLESSPAPQAATRAAARSNAEGETPAADRIRHAVESRLLSMGYGDLRILSDLNDVSLDADTEVRVECSRQNMVAKGKILTRNGSVFDVDLTPIARVFP